jgi:hypothetical protein
MFPVLEEFHVACHTLGIELMMAFLHRHGKLQQFYLTILLRLGPLDDAFLDLMENILRTRSSEELVASLIKTANEEAYGQ